MNPFRTGSIGEHSVWKNLWFGLENIITRMISTTTTALTWTLTLFLIWTSTLSLTLTVT